MPPPPSTPCLAEYPSGARVFWFLTFQFPPGSTEEDMSVKNIDIALQFFRRIVHALFSNISPSFEYV